MAQNCHLLFLFFPLFLFLAPVSGHLPTSRNPSRAGIGTAIHSFLRLVYRQDKQPRTPPTSATIQPCLAHALRGLSPSISPAAYHLASRAWPGSQTRQSPSKDFSLWLHLIWNQPLLALHTPWSPSYPSPPCHSTAPFIACRGCIKTRGLLP